MILLADSGSTKTDWCLVDHGQSVLQVYTKGTNPFFQTAEEISYEIEKSLIPQLGNDPVDAVFFYGAGCAFPDKNRIVSSAIAEHIDAPIEVGSDLLAAARSLCGKEAGIACIMGTGSNSCFYDGREIVDNVSPLGFILGDEGSGAVLGKLLVGDCLKNQLSPALQARFFKQFNISRAEILDRVYKQPFPNRFLASLSPFLAQNIREPEIHRLVSNSFRAFFMRNVMQYDYRKYKVHLIGSVAYFYQDILREIADELGIKLGRIIQSPMKGLVNYHS